MENFSKEAQQTAIVTILRKGNRARNQDGNNFCYIAFFTVFIYLNKSIAAL